MGSNALVVKSRLPFLYNEDVSILFCPLCHAYIENVEHLLLNCCYARVLWMESYWLLNLEAFGHLSMLEWVGVIIQPELHLGLKGPQGRDFTLFAAIVSDTIWYYRNQVVHNNIQPDINAIILLMKRRYWEHACAWRSDEAEGSQYWIPPPPSVWKLNCDAAAVVCRGFCSRLISAWTDFIGSSNPLLAELSAAFLACEDQHPPPLRVRLSLKVISLWLANL